MTTKKTNPKPPEFQRFQVTIKNLDDPKHKTKVFEAHGLVFFAGQAVNVIKNAPKSPDLSIEYGLVGDRVVNSLLVFNMPGLVEKFLREQAQEYEAEKRGSNGEVKN